MTDPGRGRDQRIRAGRTLLGTARPARAHHQHGARASRPRPRQLLPLRARPRGGHRQRPRPVRKQPDPASCGIVGRRRPARALRERRRPGPGSSPQRRRTAQARGHGDSLHPSWHRWNPVTAGGRRQRPPSHGPHRPRDRHVSADTVLSQARTTAVRSCEAWWQRADAQPGRAGRSIYAASLSALASAWPTLPCCLTSQPHRSCRPKWAARPDEGWFWPTPVGPWRARRLR